MFCILVLLGYSDTKDLDIGGMDMEGMDNMLGGIGSLMEGLSNMGDKECAYHCPAGKVVCILFTWKDELSNITLAIFL